jgi:hypothetical protein
VLCQKALEVLVEESNVQRVDAPVTVCELCVNLLEVLLCVARPRSSTSRQPGPGWCC